jgi:hypothetical protein
VQAAFEREHRQGSTVLFPLRIDDAVMDSTRAWAADIRRTRHIGDFRKWKDNDSFHASFARLLHDLRSQISQVDAIIKASSHAYNHYKNAVVYGTGSDQPTSACCNERNC